MIDKNLGAWSFQNAVGFYINERTRAADLYPSEAAVLHPLIGRISSVLDVGCAVGGFSSIFKELDPAIAYTGIDTAAGMIEQAGRAYPGVNFRAVSEGTLPFDDNAFDLVFCTGVLNHNPDYIDMIEDMLRVSRKYLVVDLPRLVTGPYEFDLSHSWMILKDRFPEGSEGLDAAVTKVPYVLANTSDAMTGIFERLTGRISGLSCGGYFGKTNPSVTIPYREVIFAVTLLVKGSGRIKAHFALPEAAQIAATAAATAAGCTLASSVDEVLGA